MLLEHHQQAEHARNLQQDVQPDVTTFTFGDVSCFQPVAEVSGPGCRMVPTTGAAGTEGSSAAVLQAVLSPAPGWLEKLYHGRSAGSEGDQQKFHDVV